MVLAGAAGQTGGGRNMPGFNDESLIQCAVKDEVESCREKLASGSDPSSANPMGQTALHIAAIWGSMGVGALLIEAGATIEAANKMGGITPLMCAAQRGRTEFARLLLARGADPKTQDDSGRVAFMFAEDDELRELLGGPSGELCRAVRTGDPQKVEEVASRRPELVAAKDGSGNTPLVIAVQKQHWNIARWLLGHADAARFVNTRSSEGDTPLQLVARFEQTELVDALIQAGADVNLKSLRLNEYTRGNYEMIDPETGEKKVVSSEHQTPIFECAETGNTTIAKMLIDGGCNVDMTDGDGCTALYTAMVCGDGGEEDGVSEMLLAAGASPDIGNADIGKDNTLLAWAASRRSLGHVDQLLRHGADPNRPGKSGMYPLHMAARCGGKAVMESLLKNGADPTRTCRTHSNCPGVTARQVVEKNNQAVAAGCLDVLDNAVRGV